MLKNYIKIAVRNSIKNKLYSFINVFGLSVGLAAFIFITLYVYEETHYDTFWDSADRIIRIDGAWTSNEGESRYATAPPPLAGQLMAQVPEIESVTRMLKWSDFTLRPSTDLDRIFRETNVYIADQKYFEVFQGRLKHGNPSTALVHPLSIVISESVARRYFGPGTDLQGLIGAHILGGKDASTVWKITGIMEDIPSTSHKEFEMMVSMSSFGTEFSGNENWAWNIMHTYALIQEAGQYDLAVGAIEQKLDLIIRDYVLPYMGRPSTGGSDGVKYYVQPLQDIHLHADYLREMKPNSDITYVYIFGAVAVLILLIACVNFTNLATALSAKRTKEVGVRKTLGSRSSYLVVQFLVESLLFSFVATALALGMIELTVLLFGADFDLRFAGKLFDTPGFLWILLSLAVITGLVAGIYPALVLTRFKPTDVLKGELIPGHSAFTLRHILVVFQFTASIGLIISTGIISDQVKFMENKRLGFEKENVIIIENDREIEEHRSRFKEALEAHPEILEVSFTTGIPALDRFMVRDFTVEGSTGSMGIRWFEVDEDFVPTMDMEIVEGRNFRWGSPSDSLGILLNQQAVLALGLEDPVGKNITINQGAEDEHTAVVLGIVKDFHFESLHRQVKPLGMEYLRNYALKDFISLRTAPGKTSEALGIIKNAWTAFEPQVPITYHFLDQDFEALHRSEQRLAQLFAVFSALALLIAGLGLFGLAAYITQQRSREISIRKVLGATVSQIVFMLLKNFAWLAMLGLLIASLAVFFGMEEWLNSFAFRTSIRIEQFVIAAVVTGVILIFSVSYQALKVAMENPVNHLKEE